MGAAAATATAATEAVMADGVAETTTKILIPSCDYK